MNSAALTDVDGISVGHHTLADRPTGCTVVLCPGGATAGVDVRGGAPGTRETDLLRPDNLVEQVHAVLLTGGSAFGLAAAGGVMQWLEERGHGLRVGNACVPIVPAAVLFDLWLETPTLWEGGRSGRPVRPDAEAGYAACEAATREPAAQGSVGAGTGASVGKLFGIERAMKGGIGSASITVGAITVAALVAVNATGDVIDPRSGRVIAGTRGADGQPRSAVAALCNGELPARAIAGMATTIGVIATDAVLTKAQANKLATMAHDGLARTIHPVHTMADGDTLFALATGASGRPGELTVLGVMAAEVTAQAVLNAVRHARGLTSPDLPSARDLGRA
jgi:L-aminopeptidase/D-esterase-like protein